MPIRRANGSVGTSTSNRSFGASGDDHKTRGPAYLLLGARTGLSAGNTRSGQSLRLAPDQFPFLPAWRLLPLSACGTIERPGRSREPARTRKSHNSKSNQPPRTPRTRRPVRRPRPRRGGHIPSLSSPSVISARPSVASPSISRSVTPRSRPSCRDRVPSRTGLGHARPPPEPSCPSRAASQPCSGNRVEIVEDPRRPPQPPLRHSFLAAEVEVVVGQPDRHPRRSPAVPRRPCTGDRRCSRARIAAVPSSSHQQAQESPSHASAESAVIPAPARSRPEPRPSRPPARALLPRCNAIRPAARPRSWTT